MSIILEISLGVILLGIILILVDGYMNGNSAPIGVILIFMSLFIGCCLLGSGYPITKGQIEYLTPESIFQDDNYCVVVLNSKAYILDKLKDIKESKNSEIKIAHQINYNSYGFNCEEKYWIELFDKNKGE